MNFVIRAVHELSADVLWYRRIRVPPVNCRLGPVRRCTRATTRAGRSSSCFGLSPRGCRGYQLLSTSEGEAPESGEPSTPARPLRDTYHRAASAYAPFCAVRRGARRCHSATRVMGALRKTLGRAPRPGRIRNGVHSTVCSDIDDADLAVRTRSEGFNVFTIGDRKSVV